MPWANGGGVTTEVIAWPSPDDWWWRLSMATVDSDGPFSRFPDIDRTIALLDGAGFVLTIDGEPDVTIDRRLEPFEFSGDADTNCSLLGGPVCDLNLMSRRGPVRMQLEIVRLSEVRVLPAAVALLVLEEAIDVGDNTLSRWDAIVSPDGRAIRIPVRDVSTGAVVAVVRPINPRGGRRSGGRLSTSRTGSRRTPSR